ncbi:dihydrofolate reductase [Undibacterium luofuense]|uniref:Dihydrofolate reductase n=1 Tax=Undibacterium luofuense TaxID=2828733 RepID=A0A941DNZ6_9BURK|nr:dihydrofolate reductase [Undibacterium luofuense]MBR7783290.1 dihydrofolate reductase [Undibacterium luofuense]
MSSFIIIVARDKHSGIGIQNALPWHLPEDLSHFKKTTSGHAILMGRKTFESIGRPLPNRRNIVITRNPDWKADGIEICHSLEEAKALVKEQTAYIIGGAEIYRQAFDLADKMIITEIDQTFECDAFFPSFSNDAWQETEREAHVSASGIPYAFVTYTKKNKE